MVDLLDPKPGETVYDPACGTGGMLIESIRHMKYDHLTYGRIYGQENNLSTSAIARMNLFLHGAKDVRIKQGDTLRNPLFLEKGKLKTFSCVLANPPFGMEKWGAQQFESDKCGRNIWGCPTDSNADFAWLQHMIKSMDPQTGRCAVVLPQGVLFHGGKEGTIREQLVKSDKLEAVITLASGVFYSTGVSASILFLTNKKLHSHKGRICLIDGSEIYKAQRAQNEISPENVKTLYELYTNYTDVIERCKIVTIQDVEDGGFDLSVKKYIEKKKQKTVPPEVVRKRYFEALENVRAAEDKMKELLIEGGYVNE
jgi:type I restriction enzyme M protein